MSTTAPPDRLLTIEEYAELPDDGWRTELVRGRVVREPQPSYEHGRVQVAVATLLRNYLEKHAPHPGGGKRSGQVFHVELGRHLRYVGMPDGTTVRGASMPTRKVVRRPPPRGRSSAGDAGAGGTRSTAQEWVGRFGGKYAGRLDLRSDLELAKAVEKGLPAQAVEVAVKGGILDQDDVYRLVVSKRTLQRRREEKRLSPDESDKLTRVVRVIARAEVALGDPRKAERWIREPNRALQGKLPLDLLSSDVGARAVEKVLGRIEHGIFS